MSVRGRIMAFFPAVHAALILVNGVAAFYDPGWLGCLVFSIWLFPLLCWRMHHWFWPLKTGLSYLARPAYSPWWGSYQTQYLFLILPGLERILHVVPGLFSLWLRAWGSTIGKGVFWTPHTLILDRSLLNFGDRIIVGHRCSFSSHIISINKKGELILFVKSIEIGSSSFIGAGSDIGPGTKIAPSTQLPMQSQLYPNQKVGSLQDSDA